MQNLKTHVVRAWPKYVMIDSRDERYLVSDIEHATKFSEEVARNVATLMCEEDRMRAKIELIEKGKEVKC